MCALLFRVTDLDRPDLEYCGVSLERTVKRYIVDWISELPQAVGHMKRKRTESLQDKRKTNYYTRYSLPHLHDCFLIVNETITLHHLN